MRAHFLSHVEYCLISCRDQLKVKFIPEASERFVLGSPSSYGHISAVLSVYGDLVYEADLNVHRTNTSTSYHSIIKDNHGSPYKLQQIQDCLNYVTKSLEKIKSAEISTSVNDLTESQSFLFELFSYIRDAKDCLTQPPRKTIEEHLANPSRVECVIPRLQETLSYLDAAMNTLMYLMNKRNIL
ncbi:unnamed protein product [Schistosoma haematobium]|nr:unnamed protein product [Schistosoma haematobium]